MKKLFSHSWLTASESGFVYIQTADAADPFETELEAQGESAETTAADLTSDIAQDVTEYHGPIICCNGTIDMVLFPGDYATINGTAVTFHYYTQDFLGNNRALINGTTGAISRFALGLGTVETLD